MIKFLKGLKLEILLNIKKYVSDFMLIDKIYWTKIQVKIAQSVLDAFRQMHLNLDKFLNTMLYSKTFMCLFLICVTNKLNISILYFSRLWRGRII